MRKQRKFVGIVIVLVLIMEYMLIASATPAQLAGLERQNYEKIKLIKMGAWGQKYEIESPITIPLKFGYYIDDYAVEKTGFQGQGYIRVSFQKEDGSIGQELQEVDVSDEDYRLDRKNGKLKGSMECIADLPFECMEDTGKIEVSSALWYRDLENETYELLTLSNTNISSGNWKDALFPVEEDDWEKYKTCFYYIKTGDGVLVYKNRTPLISIRLYCVEKMRDFTLYEEGD